MANEIILPVVTEEARENLIRVKNDEKALAQLEFLIKTVVAQEDPVLAKHLEIFIPDDGSYIRIYVPHEVPKTEENPKEEPPKEEIKEEKPENESIIPKIDEKTLDKSEK